MTTEKLDPKLTLEMVGAELDAVYVSTRLEYPDMTDPAVARQRMANALTQAAKDLTERLVISHVKIICNEENNPTEVLERGDLVVSLQFLFLGEGTAEKLDPDSTRVVEMNLFSDQASARQPMNWSE